MTRDELLRLTPDRYLAAGFRDAAGLERPELRSVWALAGVEQLRAQGVTAAQLEPVVAAVTRPQAKAPEGTDPGSRFVRDCLAQVKSEADRPVFAQHLASVLRLLALAEATAPFNAAADQARRR